VFPNLRLLLHRRCRHHLHTVLLVQQEAFGHIQEVGSVLAVEALCHHLVERSPCWEKCSRLLLLEMGPNLLGPNHDVHVQVVTDVCQEELAVVVHSQDGDSDAEAACDRNLEGTCSGRVWDGLPVLLRLEEAEEALAAARSILQLMDVAGNDDAEDASDVGMAVDDQK
jgi:hypothetical protein